MLIKVDRESRLFLVPPTSESLVALVMHIKIHRFIKCAFAEQVNSLLEDEGGDMRAATAVSHPKYWDQRYRLFSKFDDGIIIPDEESWFSVGAPV